MVVYQWRQTTPVFFCHSLLPDRRCQHILDQQCIYIDQTDLQQVQREYRQFLILREIAGKFSVFAIKNKIIGAVPVFNDIETRINFATQCIESLKTGMLPANRPALIIRHSF